MQNVSALRDFAIRCRTMAQAETDRRLKSMFLLMAEDYERRVQEDAGKPAAG